MLQVNWVKCGEHPNIKWCSLINVNLKDVNTSGVYVIWHGGSDPRVVRVGQGDIKERLIAHRGDREILAYAEHGLFVTWAAVSTEYQNGVEAYLADHYSPLIGDRFPDVEWILVNLPT